MMLSCIIVDDEPLALDLLEDYIKNVPYLHLMGRCSNAMAAIEILQNNKIDLVFSDIKMQGLSGLQLIKTLAVKPMFIIITAYSSYAVESYELDVVDYLLKPVPFERFIRACNKALTAYNSQQSMNQQASGRYIFFHADYSLIKVMLDEVLYIEGVKDYVKIHYTSQGKVPLLIRHSMKGIEEAIPAAKFIRIHKSYIVHTGQVTAIRKNSLFLGNLELPVTESYKKYLQLLTNKKI
jgi:two-component system, LytTR family, response regulator